jgi:archaemetzincin
MISKLFLCLLSAVVAIERLKPLHLPLGEPQEGDWLSSHQEAGQTFKQYGRSRPNVLTRRRHKLYIQPIGQFSQKQIQLIELSREFLKIYFHCEVETLATKTEKAIPDAAQRFHPQWGDHQLLTSYILEKILAPELPDDAFATIAFTTSDLWPGDRWNFVFGYASFRDRVGVWSLYRFGDPEKGDGDFRQCLKRTLKLATHETGHMFSIQHCTAYRCNMQGSNSLQESDRQPTYLCPECHAKILYATKADPIERYQKLIEFCKTHKLTDEMQFFQKAKAKLQE